MNIQVLEDRLSDLAYQWRNTQNSALVAEYQQTLRDLIQLGFTGYLDTESQVPNVYMPTEYLTLKR